MTRGAFRVNLAAMQISSGNQAWHTVRVTKAYRLFPAPECPASANDPWFGKNCKGTSHLPDGDTGMSRNPELATSGRDTIRYRPPYRSRLLPSKGGGSGNALAIAGHPRRQSGLAKVKRFCVGVSAAAIAARATPRIVRSAADIHCEPFFIVSGCRFLSTNRLTFQLLQPRQSAHVNHPNSGGAYRVVQRTTK
jgi:hypothetical protein